ncbi:hypothetical protein AB1Y20_019545 [Prymnesium parvum]|uniref:Transmembrane protein n=1 Tax=Prymnesium parvum TaxID=97485 RepID=A0AB34JRD3_PRYPA
MWAGGVGQLIDATTGFLSGRTPAKVPAGALTSIGESASSSLADEAAAPVSRAPATGSTALASPCQPQVLFEASREDSGSLGPSGALTVPPSAVLPSPLTRAPASVTDIEVWEDQVRQPPMLLPPVEAISSKLLFASTVQIRKQQSAAKAQVCFIPAGYRMPRQKLVQMISSTWKLGFPNLIVSCDAGSAHPTQLSTIELARLKQFRHWCKGEAIGDPDPTGTPATGIPEASLQTTERLTSQISRRGHPVTQSAQEQDPTQHDIDMINKLMFQKLVTTMAAVLDAAALSNNWVLVDRTSNKSAKSATAELLLELAMEQTEQRPTVLVIDTMERLREFNSKASKLTASMLARLKAKAVPVGSEESQSVEQVEWPYESDMFIDPAKFYDLPLPREPFAEHVNDNGEVSAKRKWMYHYSESVFSGGTHYIILDRAEDMFDIDVLGPVGNVVAHGGTLAYRRLRKNIQTGRPTVMLHNTGGATQAFGSVHRALYPHLNSREIPDAAVLLKRVEVVSTEKWAKSFGIPEVVMMRDLAERAPQLFRKTVVTVDMVADTAEDVLETLTACFASGAGGVPELGLAGADTNVVLVAWKRHLALYTNAARFRRWSHGIAYTLYSLSLLTTTVSVLYSLFGAWVNEDRALAGVLGSDSADVNSAWYARTENYLQNAVIVLPIVAAMWTTIRSRLRSREKWADCLVACHEIAAEIYKFRARTMEYDMALSRVEEEDTEKEEDVHVKSDEQKTREMFTQRVQSIYAGALSGDVGSTGALAHDGVLMANMEVPHERASFVEQLHVHLRKHIFEQKPKKRQASAQSIRILQLLEVLVFISNSLGAVLALTSVGRVPLATFVALSVSFASVFSSMIEYHNLQQQVSATNAAVSDVHNLLTFWAGLSMVDRRTRHTKYHVVSTVERFRHHA